MSESINHETPIFLLHGLGSHTITLYPLEKYLNYIGYTNTHCLNYPIDKMDINESVDYIDKLMTALANKKEKVILIGQSMGGVIANNMHNSGWKVKKAVYIGSPLHGAHLLNQLEEILPTPIRNFFYKKPYGILQQKGRELEPPHPYHTISMGWFNSHFDGCVYKEESMLDTGNHTHLGWADHRTVFANPRLWITVGDILAT